MVREYLCSNRHAATDPRRCIVAASCTCAGGNVELLRTALLTAPGAGCREYGELDVLASRAPSGSNGLLYLPHLSGERCPFSAPTARGAWVGLHPGSTSADMHRAVLEASRVHSTKRRRAHPPYTREPSHLQGTTVPRARRASPFTTAGSRRPSRRGLGGRFAAL